jgi:NADH-quinone oxidoreductase subunit D
MMADVPDGFEAELRGFCQTFPKTLDEVDTVFTRNAIWCGRTQGVGVIGYDEAINYSLSGPMLRASGVDYDVRKDRPYLGYDTYDFDVPVGEHGDIYDRYRIRLEEMYQSTRILEQALDRLARLKGAPLNVSDPKVILPPKSRAMSDMEAMIFHFKQVMEGGAGAAGRGLHGGWKTPRASWAPTWWPMGRPSRCAGGSGPRPSSTWPASQALRGRTALRRHRHQRQRGHRHGRIDR